jgi:hypothetical protein
MDPRFLIPLFLFHHHFFIFVLFHVFELLFDTLLLFLDLHLFCFYIFSLGSFFVFRRRGRRQREGAGWNSGA